MFTGRVPPADARRAITATDIAPIVRPESAVGLLVPPLKPLDAMAGGAALVLSDVPPLAEIAGRDRASLVRAGDRAALTAAFRTLIDHEDERQAMVARAHAWATQERSWRAIAREMLSERDRPA